MNFKKWLELQEVGTSTGSIAVFARPVMPMVGRIWPNWGNETKEDKPKKKKKKNR